MPKTGIFLYPCYQIGDVFYVIEVMLIIVNVHKLALAR